MTITIISDVIEPLVLDAGSRTIISAGVSATSSTNFAVQANGLDILLRNIGEINGLGRNGIEADGVDVTILNTVSGSISGLYDGYVSKVQDGALINEGSITGGFAAVDFDGSASSVINNSGTFSGTFFGLALRNGSIENMVNNSGTIQATGLLGNGIAVSADSFGNKILNTGDINGTAYGIRNDGAGTDIENFGTIDGKVAVYATEATDMVNDGTITGVTASFRVNNLYADATVTNRGTMNGDIQFSGGVDILRNTGTINGDIFTGTGRDSVNNKGAINGTIELGEGHDIYSGTLATSGATVDGGAGNDRLRGGNYDDDLRGGAGRDVIKSGDGADRLTGGGDRDILSGGAGADVFIYVDATDTQGGTEIITDFDSAEDLVDLSALAEQLFVFVGDNSLMGGGVASVQTDTRSNGHTFVNVDVDGDGARDIALLLQYAGTLTGDDFIL